MSLNYDITSGGNIRSHLIDL